MVAVVGTGAVGRSCLDPSSGHGSTRSGPVTRAQFRAAELVMHLLSSHVSQCSQLEIPKHTANYGGESVNRFMRYERFSFPASQKGQRVYGRVAI